MNPSTELHKVASLLTVSAELFRIAWKSSQSPSTLASTFLHAKKNLSSTERQWISALVFTALRNTFLAAYCVEVPCSESQTLDVSSSLSIVFAVLVLGNEIGFDSSDLSVSIDPALFPTIAAILNISSATIASQKTQQIISRFTALDKKCEELKRNSHQTVSTFLDVLSVRYSVPLWLLRQWMENKHRPHSVQEVHQLAKSLTTEAPVNLRVNLSKTSIVNAQLRLTEEGCDTERGSYSPVSLKLSKRKRVIEKNVYRDGLFEVQDEASQLVSYAVSPGPNWTILDACAGAGGKSLQLADMQSDHGTIISMDTDFRRLQSLQQRAHKCGLHSIVPAPLRKGTSAATLLRGQGHTSFAAVLVDAPCSGIGTARRNPLMKWRLSHQLLLKFATQQLDILESYAKFVRPGGVLVYATCSFMPTENEGVINAFLKKHSDFFGDALLPVFEQHGIVIPGIQGGQFHVTLTPSRHGSDGFFICRMIREL